MNTKLTRCGSLVYLGLIVWLAFAFSGFVHACVVCVPYPTKTVADQLIESDTVVLARENPNKLWTYYPIETLKGEGQFVPIDVFINSPTRKLLEIYPQRGVILVKSGRDDSDWRSLGFAREEYEAVVREIIKRSPSWGSSGVSDNARLAFFADLLGHENREIHELAYLEIGRAPYADIKALSSKWPLEQIRKLLRNPIYVEWHPLAILMLAQSESAADHEYILSRLASLAQFGLTTNLAAWTTAAIEIREENAVHQIEQDYFSQPSRSREELLGVITALSEHGTNGHTHLRDRIVQSYSTLLQAYPGMASHVAKDLITWERWELADQLSDILDTDEHPDPLDTYLVKLYLAHARDVMAGY